MRWKGVILSAVVGTVMYLTLLAGSNPEAALAAAASLPVSAWLIILGLSLFNYGLRFLRWNGYLRYFGERVPLVRQLLVYFAGFALTTTPAKAGEALRALYLKPAGVSYGRSIAALYAERLMDMLSMALLAALLYRFPVPGNTWLVMGSLSIACGLILVQRPSVIALAGRLMDSFPWQRLRDAAAHAVGCLQQASELFQTRMFMFGAALGIISWGAEAVAFNIVLDALDIPVDLTIAVGIYATSMLAGALSFLPGGLGSVEAVMIALLVIAGAPPPAAVAATTIIRIATLWFAVGLGAIALAVTEASQRRYTAVTVGAGGNAPPAGK